MTGQEQRQPVLTWKEVPGWAELPEREVIQRKDPLKFGQFSHLAASAIHRRLQKLKPDPAAIEAFAEKWGFLGTPRCDLRPVEVWQGQVEKARKNPDSALATWRIGPFRSGERLADWTFELSKIRTLIDLWDWKCRRSRLSRPDVERTLHEPGASTEYSPAQVPLPRGESLEVQIEMLLEFEVNAVLQSELRPIAHLADQRWSYQVRSLLGVAYYRFAEELLGYAFPRQCEVCGEWYESEDPRRRTCSGTCRTNKARRAKRVREERANGKKKRTTRRKH